MLNTKGKGSDRKASKTIDPGNQRCKIYGLSLAEGYKHDENGSYKLVMNLETEPIEGFEGFFIDKNDESKGRHLGQVGRVNYSQWAFQSKTIETKDGPKDIDRDEGIMFAIANLATAFGVRDQIDQINSNLDKPDAETVEEYVKLAEPILCSTENYVYFCIAGREYKDKKNYTQYELFLPKASGKKYAFSAEADQVMKFNSEQHIIAAKTSPTINEFAPPTEDEFTI